MAKGKYKTAIRTLVFNIDEIDTDYIESEVSMYLRETFYTTYDINTINQSQSDGKLIITVSFCYKTKWLNVIITLALLLITYMVLLNLFL